MKLFVYGTLLYPDIRYRILNKDIKTERAILRGFKKEGLNIVKDIKSFVDGEIMHITMEDLKALDLYEGNAYKKINIKINGDSLKAYQLK